MRISHDELMALSPSEREAVVWKLAHPEKDAELKPKQSMFTPLIHMIQNLIRGGRAAR